MDYKIIKRPRTDSNEVKIFELIKNNLRKANKSEMHNLVDNLIMDFNSENGTDFKFHYDNYDLFVFENNSAPIVHLKINGF